MADGQRGTFLGYSRSAVTRLAANDYLLLEYNYRDPTKVIQTSRAADYGNGRGQPRGSPAPAASTRRKKQSPKESPYLRQSQRAQPRSGTHPPTSPEIGQSASGRGSRTADPERRAGGHKPRRGARRVGTRDGESDDDWAISFAGVDLCVLVQCL